MNSKSITLCAAVAAACLIATIVVYRNYAHQNSASMSQQRARNSSSIAHSLAVESPIQPRFPRVINANPAVSNAPVAKAEAQADASAPAQKSTAEGPLHDPFARDALALVGADPEAELYWLDAINDLSLPANERQDLIEDLNEEGLTDPKHPTLEDLPLILNRLAIIEIVGPDAADKVNADAFDEAYKDLLNLAELAMGGGEPVN